MPVHYAIVDSVVLIVLDGVVDDEMLLSSQRDLFNDPNFDGSYPRLIDASLVTKMKLRSNTVREIAHQAIKRGLKRSALVANGSDLIFGLMRMYACYAGDEAVVEVFHDRKQALNWLRTGVMTEPA